MLYMTADGSAIDGDGKIIYFSVERFVRDICEGKCCFICGAHRNDKPFNDEHVLPNWILKRFELHQRTVTLPNGTSFRYGRYTIPCCVDCNALIGREVEEPIRELITQGRDAVSQYIREKGHLLFFVWAALIFLKTHLRDQNFRFDQDLRSGDRLISDLYSWEDLHHVHTVARYFYTGCRINPSVLGTFLALPAKIEPFTESFDFGDLYASQTMLLRLDNMAFLVIFNDSCGVTKLILGLLKRITGELSAIQLRELAAHIASLNIHLKERPTYLSRFDPGTEEYLIDAAVPKHVTLTELQPEVRGKIMHHLLDSTLTQVEFAGKADRSAVMQRLREGKWTFLFDKDGKFISEQFVPLGRAGYYTDGT